MTNLITYEPKSNKISMFIKDCVKRGKDYTGSNMKLSGVKPGLFSIRWTDDIAYPEYDIEGNLIGWSKKVSEMKEADPGEEIEPVSEEEYRKAVKIRKFLANLDYDKLDAYIDKNVIASPSTKSYLKKLSKVVLSTIRMMDKE